MVALVEDDVIERVAARLHADPLQDVVAPAVLQRQPVDEHLGDGLQRERMVVVADAVDLAVGGRKTDAEPGPLRLREVRRIVPGDLALIQRQVTPVQLFQPLVYPSPDVSRRHASSLYSRPLTGARRFPVRSADGL